MERRRKRVAVREWRHRRPGEILDLTGHTFGRLTAMRCTRSDSYGRSMWLCVCTCSRTKEVRVDFLRNGTTASCGCLRGGYLPPLSDARSTPSVEEHW